MKKLVYVIWMAERYDDERIRYEFETKEEMVWFIKSMQGVLRCYESYSEWVKA